MHKLFSCQAPLATNPLSDNALTRRQDLLLLRAWDRSCGKHNPYLFLQPLHSGYCSIVMHIHDELVIEADPRMSLDTVCEQIGRTPPWAKGLLLRADGYITPFYKKD